MGGKKSNIGCEKIAYIGQDKLWWEVHSYKGLTPIFEEVASELLFGLAVHGGKNKKWVEKNRILVVKK